MVLLLNANDFTVYAEFTGHMAGDDLSLEEKPPEAFLDISSVTDNHVAGDLSIKGILHPVDVDVMVNLKGDILTVSAKVVVNRAKIQYEISLR